MNELRLQVSRYELRYEMTSSTMRERFAKGEIDDTADISDWLMLLRVLDRLSK